MKLKNFIENVANVAEACIKKYQEYKELSGEDKKQRVDDLVTEYCNNVISTLEINVITRFIIKKVLIANIPTITQIIFNLIKTRIEGITK